MTTVVCECGREEFKDSGRCVFHQPPQKAKDPVLICTVLHYGSEGRPTPSFPHTRSESYVAALGDVAVIVSEITGRFNLPSPQWYFINHFGYIDLVFNPPKQSQPFIKALRKIAVGPVLTIGKLDEPTYFGKEGVALCYEALHQFSRLRLMAAANGALFNLDCQLIHFFMNQRGFDNQDEVNYHVRCASGWTGKLLEGK